MFPILENTVTKVEQKELLVAQKQTLTDIYVSLQGQSQSVAYQVFMSEATKVGINTFETKDAVETSFKKKGEIANTVLSIMKQEIMLEDICYDTDGNVVTEAEYNAIPLTSTELKEAVYQFFPDCSKTALEYNVAKIIAYADGTGTCSYAKFLTFFKD